MRVLFLTLYPDIVASPRYRVMQYLPYLRDHGVECRVTSALTGRWLRALTGPGRRGRPLWYHLVETPRRLSQILTARKYDLVFVQKALMTAYLRGAVAVLRACARRIVYDFDDAVQLGPPHALRFVWRFLEDRAQVNKMLATAALVLAGNAWLRSAAEAAGAHAVHFPTVIDTEHFTPATRPPDTYRVGWIGTPAATPCLEPAAEALASLDDGEICLVGADAGQVPWSNVGGRVGNASLVVRPWSLETEVDALRGFAVGLMPVPKVEWMKGKCGLKALLYMACGVPCITTPYGVALEFIQHEENGLFADSPGEWRDALRRLRDPALRRRMGEAARATVEERYSLRKAAPRLLELLGSAV